MSADVMFSTGDLSLFDFTTIEELIPQKVAFGVYGNHDTPGYLERLGIINLHLKVFKWNGFTIGGYQGSPRYKAKGIPFKISLNKFEKYFFSKLITLHTSVCY